jgi:hypothetical protein
MNTNPSAREVAMKLDEMIEQVRIYENAYRAFRDLSTWGDAAYKPINEGDRELALSIFRRARRGDTATLPPELATVPEGWKLAPVEPDEKMRQAGIDAYFSDDNVDGLCDVYRAMLAAAPKPEGKT